MTMSDRATWTQRWARWFTEVAVEGGMRRPVRLVVMHTMESAEKGDTAESVAKYFETTATKASAHLCVDSDSVVQCVEDQDVAWAAPGANKNGMHVELAGSMRQTPEQWADDYSDKVLTNAAAVVARLCFDHAVPAVRLTDKQLADGTSRGIVGHDQCARVFKKEAKPEEHQDPGAAFPWDEFMTRVWTAIGPGGPAGTGL